MRCPIPSRIPYSASLAGALVKQAAPANDPELDHLHRAVGNRPLGRRKRWAKASRWVIRGSRLLRERSGRIRAIANTEGGRTRAKATPLQARFQLDTSPGCGAVGAGVSPA